MRHIQRLLIFGKRYAARVLALGGLADLLQVRPFLHLCAALIFQSFVMIRKRMLPSSSDVTGTSSFASV